MIVIGNLETAQRNAKHPRSPNPNLERALGNAMRGATGSRLDEPAACLLAPSGSHPKPIDPNRFLSSAADFLQRAIGERVEVEVVGTAGSWQIEVDPNHLETTLLNLVINSRDAMPDGGKITLEVANIFADEEYCRLNPEFSPGQYVLICVSDTGCGMPPDVVDHAFEPFFTTKELGHGTGLGLSQVYGFVKQSGGHVKIYSEDGQGTTVKNLSASTDLLGRARQPPTFGTPGGSELGEVILVVEDDEDVRLYISDALRSFGYHVLASAHAQSALAFKMTIPHASI